MIKKFAVLLMCFSLGVLAVPGCSKDDSEKDATPAANGDTPADNGDTPADNGDTPADNGE